jgi:hypothetical protein
MSRFAELKAYAPYPTWPFNIPQSHAGSATQHKSRNPEALRPDIGRFLDAALVAEVQQTKMGVMVLVLSLVRIPHKLSGVTIFLA